MIKKSEFLIIGSGVAGMSYALKVANAGKGKVTLICKTTLEESNTTKAQGGIAAGQKTVDSAAAEVHGGSCGICGFTGCLGGLSGIRFRW